MIMSMFTMLPASAENTLAATPVVSGTWRMVTFISDVSWAIPVMTACSTGDSSLTYVPSLSENADLEWMTTPHFFANSTARDCSTPDPTLESSSISS